MRFAIKALGDETSQLLDVVRPGMPAVIGGPFGRFSHEKGTSRQLWIAGGIGVTPFLSWLRALDNHPLRGRVDFFYTSASANTRLRVASLTSLFPFSARDTVPMEISRRRASSRIFTGCMPIGDDLLPERGLTGLGAPAYAVGDEELLIARISVIRWRRGAREREPVGIMGGGQASHVGNVFAERLQTVHVQIREWTIAIVLRRQPHAGRAEARQIGLAPPVAEAPVGVELRALIIEAVTDLVANRGANVAEIERRWIMRVKKRRLEDTRRKIQGVHRWQVYGVYGLRRHHPLGPIDRLAEFRERVR